MALSPPSSRSSGLPSSWTDGGSGDVGAQATAGNKVPLTINAIVGQTNDLFDINGTVGALFVQNDGTVTLVLNNASVFDGLSIIPAGAQTVNNIRVADPSAPFGPLWRVDKGGYMGVLRHAAPADADIASGECMFWFDQTDGAGATKLMLKGKSANGTVKAATILLA